MIYVVNTNESGQGSLRACIEASGPRICIFRTGGTIVLREGSLVVRHPFLTIAGETAPGGGSPSGTARRKFVLQSKS